MTKLIIIMFIIMAVSPVAFGQKVKTVYKYKEYEKFDLGDLEIKGNIIAPGDISVKERRRKVFERKLLRKTNFDRLIMREIKFLR
mgnify:CR=1 FL=1